MLLDRRLFLVREQVSYLKLADRYDIFDPESGEQIGFAVEQNNSFIRFLRLFSFKSALPTTIVIYDSETSEPVIKLTRGIPVARVKVKVIDEHDNPVGLFQSKLLALGGGFTVHNPAGEQIAEVKGDWKGFDFKLLDLQGNSLGRVEKQWTGFVKEIFTSADTYVIEIDESVGSNRGLAALLLAAGLAIDIIFNERP